MERLVHIPLDYKVLVREVYEAVVRPGYFLFVFFFSSRRRHTRLQGDWSSDVCSSDLGRLSAYDFPARLNDITRASFAKWSQLQQGAIATDMAAVAQTTPDTAAIRRLSDASPLYNAQLRTTCVATELAGGHAENALPQSASATVNCRMLPGTAQDDVQRTLVRIVADTAVKVGVVQAAVPSPAAALKPDVMDAIERVTTRLWRIPVIPVMETGATDGLYLRNAGIPVYGVSGVFVDINDIRAHGRDERIGVQDYYDGAEYIYQLVREVSSTRR